MVRDMPLTDDNPWQVDKICENIEIVCVIMLVSLDVIPFKIF